jgi:acetoin utilization deacetylase AcuC-like enzyme/GNAT superfamily N-acetyltransferase
MAFRILKIHDDVSPFHQQVVAEAQLLIRRQFPGENPAVINRLADNLRDPMGKKLRSILFAVLKGNDMQGFALLYHSVKPAFCYLDYIAVLPETSGRGIGSALYARVREEAVNLRVDGLFFECLPDDPALSPDPAIRHQNERRLAFYERYGAYPITGTAYETPVSAGDTDPPYLVYDDLGTGESLSRTYLRQVVRAILKRKYGHLCPPDYIRMVADSISDNPVKTRTPRYHKKPVKAVVEQAQHRIPVVVNREHDIHHVRERGYVESPVRISQILGRLEESGICEVIPKRHYGEKHIRAVHDNDYVDYLKKVTAQIPAGKSVYPYVFPIRNADRKPSDMPTRAGYYCIDTFTPLNANAFKAALGAVDCALTAADEVLGGKRFAYALVRPPGHHAERRAFGGFCYFNSAAIAAHYLTGFGRVAMLDVDYHHGNGQQDIFYARADVLTVSIHGHPNFAYPYFTGFADEKGEGEGRGYNVNYPLKEHLSPEEWFATLQQALRRIRRHQPDFVVLALGLDTAKGDPTGTWVLQRKHFGQMAAAIAALDLPIVIVQEGGYRTQSIGANARAFFESLFKAGNA